MDSVIEIKLLGQVYALKTELNASQAKAVAEYVEEKVGAIDKISRHHSKLDVIVLAILDIANDFLEIQQKQSDLIEDIANRSQLLIHKTEAFVQRSQTGSL
ncbi:MAG: cell division protein ZapA [Deltaproteobacteria bacterium]|nr:cell division protein ZapA [Deltaproteobacteria bacterium]